MLRLRRVALAAPFLAALACNATRSADGVYFWELQTSAIQYQACTDAAVFRSSVAQLDISNGSYIVYRTQPGAQTAVTQTCASLNSSACTDNDAGIVWAVTGNVLTFSEVTEGPARANSDGGCVVHQADLWTLTTTGSDMTLDINHAYSLIDAPEDCATYDASLKAQSTNSLGIDGCQVDFKLTGVLR